MSQIKLEDYQPLYNFRILRDGWEMDNEGWIARNKHGMLRILLTNHGALYEAELDDLREIQGQTEAANKRAADWHEAADTHASELTRLNTALTATKAASSYWLARASEAQAQVAQLERRLTLRKLIKGIILTPMWPLIWLQVGFSLDKNCSENLCEVCGDNCCTNAKRMLAWWRA